MFNDVATSNTQTEWRSYKLNKDKIHNISLLGVARSVQIMQKTEHVKSVLIMRNGIWWSIDNDVPFTSIPL